MPSAPPPPVGLGMPSAPPAGYSAPPAHVPSQSVAPLAPQMAAVMPSTPPKKPDAEVKKAPSIDPKLAVLVPLGVFGILVFLALVLAVIGVVKKPWEPSDAPATASTKSSK